MITALQLEGLVTQKPRKTKYTLKPTAVSTINLINCKNYNEAIIRQKVH